MQQRIGRFLVRRFLTDSRFSRLYLCRDPGLDRLVVAKVFAVEPDQSEPPFSHDEWRERFLAEGRIMAGLDHRNILPVLEMGRLSTGREFLLLPFHPTNLPSLIGFDEDSAEAVVRHGERARPRALPAKQALPILRQVLRALAYLHDRGIVHRDVKPANLLLTAREGGIVRLCDFGMAKAGTDPDMADGKWMGSDDYISPEQFRSAGRVSDRADVYSAGVLAYRLLEGRLPRERPAEPTGVPAALARTIARAMAGDPARRPSAAEFATALNGW